jgi:hypothetical protein
MLIYPTTDLELDVPFHLQGHDVRIVTLNLTAPWVEIESRLLGWVVGTEPIHTDGA